jgi:hypothetical protein
VCCTALFQSYFNFDLSIKFIVSAIKFELSFKKCMFVSLNSVIYITFCNLSVDIFVLYLFIIIFIVLYVYFCYRCSTFLSY